VAEIEK